MRQFSPKFANQLIAALRQFDRVTLPAAREEIAYRLKLFEKAGIALDVAAEAIEDSMIDTFQCQIIDGLVPTIHPSGDLKQVMQAPWSRNASLEHTQKQGAFSGDACGRPQVESGSGRQTDKVDLVCVEPLIAPDL